jgi:hypothetical protein
VLLAAAFADVGRRWPERKCWLEVAAVALLLGNCFALQEHRFIFRHGKYRPYAENAERVQAALSPANLTRQGIEPVAAGALFEAAPYYQDAVPPSLDKDRIYLLFLARHTAAHSR